MRHCVLPLVCALACALPAAAQNHLIAFTAALDFDLDGAELGGICVMRPDGTGLRRITSFQSLGLIWEPHSFDLPDDHPDVSPDGRRIVFCSSRDGFQEWELYLMDINGSNVQRLTSSPGLDIQPVFSPDGAKVAFASQRFGSLDICVLDLATRAVTRLTASPLDDLEPAWSPDGQQIAFTRVFERGEKDVHVMQRDGSGVRRVTFADGEDHDARWAPNGQRLAITSERNFSPPYGDVWTIDLNGVNAINLTDDFAFGAGDPSWSPDGSRIAFFKSSAPIITSPQRLWVMNANGTGKQELPSAGLLNLHPNWGIARDSDGDGRADYLENSNRSHRARDFLGEEAGAHFGTAIAFADLTRDGFPDLCVGAPDQDVLGTSNAGVVFLGRGTQFGLDLGLFGASGVSLANRRVDARTFGGSLTTNGRFGATMATGDFNGDGHDDLAIGAPGQNRVFVMLSPTGPFLTLGGTGSFGSALAVADFDADGRDDLAVGAPTALRTVAGTQVAAGAVVVFRGTGGGLALLQTIGQDQLPDPGLVGGAESGDAFGTALAAANINGNLAADLAIGAPGEAIAGTNAAGVVHVVPGVAGGPLASASAVARDARSLPSPFTGLVAGARFGEVLAVGDFNGDMFDTHDVVVGVPRQPVNGSAEAGMVVVFGASLGGAMVGAPTVFAATHLGGTTQAGARLGQSLATGDFNDDNRADLAVAAPRESVGGQPQAGRVYLVHGQTEVGSTCQFCGPLMNLAGGGLITATALPLQAAQVGLPVTASAQFGGPGGSVVSLCLAAADFDQDGQDDLAIGSPQLTAGDAVGAGQIGLRFGIAVGTFAVTPAEATVPFGGYQPLRLVWTHPTQWREMATMDVRLRAEEGVVLWLRVDPERAVVSLFDPGAGVFGIEHTLGSGGVLGNSWAQVRLRDSAVAGSGPEGREVVLDLALRFHHAAAGRTYAVEVTGTDDAGHGQGFAAAGSWTVVQPGRR